MIERAVETDGPFVVSVPSNRAMWVESDEVMWWRVVR